MEISYQKGTVVAFQISESGLFELFLFQSVEKEFFYRLLFSYTQTLTTRQNSVLNPNKPLRALRTRVKAHPP